jgi:hypothetical protein
MSTSAVALTPATEIETGTVYTVTWSDGTDASTVANFTPRSGQRDDDSKANPDLLPSWLMIGGRLRRLMAWVGKRRGDPGKLEFSPWSELGDIADTFGRVFGFPGRIGFDATGKLGIHASDRDFGRGPISVVEDDHVEGTDVIVKPLAIGAGWIALVARVSPVERVLAMPAAAVAVITANMLGSSRRRTRIEALLILAERANAAYPSLLSLLDQRKVSTGKAVDMARVVRLGELLELPSALPCPTLFDFAEVGGKAALSIAEGPGEPGQFGVH